MVKLNNLPNTNVYFMYACYSIRVLFWFFKKFPEKVLSKQHSYVMWFNPPWWLSRNMKRRHWGHLKKEQLDLGENSNRCQWRSRRCHQLVPLHLSLSRLQSLNKSVDTSVWLSRSLSLSLWRGVVCEGSVAGLDLNDLVVSSVMTDGSRARPGTDLMVWDVKKTWLLNKARWMFESSDASEHRWW